MSKYTIDVEFDLEKKRFALELRRRVIGCNQEIYQITIPQHLIILACKKTNPKFQTDEEAINEIKSLYWDIGYDEFAHTEEMCNFSALYDLAEQFRDIAYEFMGYGDSEKSFCFEPILMFPVNRLELILYKHTDLLHEYNNSDYPYKYAVKTY